MLPVAPDVSGASSRAFYLWANSDGLSITHVAATFIFAATSSGKDDLVECNQQLQNLVESFFANGDSAASFHNASLSSRAT
jgi:hypothetical protein